MLLYSFLDVLEERPYRDVTISDICSRAGVHRRTFYRHFESKDDVLTRGLDQLFEDLRQIAVKDIEQRMADIEKLSVSERGVAATERLLVHLFHLIASRRAFFRHALIGTVSPELSHHLFDLAVENGMERISVDDQNRRRLLAGFAAGALLGLSRSWLETGCVTPAEHLAVQYVKLVRTAIGVAPGVAHSALE